MVHDKLFSLLIPWFHLAITFFKRIADEDSSFHDQTYTCLFKPFFSYIFIRDLLRKIYFIKIVLHKPDITETAWELHHI